MTMIFVNLPVKDLAKSRRFFEELGFAFNEQFTDDTAACLVIDENIFAMLLTEAKFKEFINGEIADPSTTETLLAVSAESRDDVDRVANKALAIGGTEWKPPLEQGPMYSRSFQDPDGHVWEVLHMDMSQG
jgi:predicted lactoylglutathione lyase